ncbi:MAG: hypothetical protein Q8L01_02840 [Candidatus Woesebacteria bacterium]|nr:hypothetical protein [Candidatus Woesebacteria bacterium]
MNQNDLNLERRKKAVLYDKKWKLFLHRARLFQYIPFVDFVFGAGSMALGNVNVNSDFDVIVGVRKGRIFMVRFFCVLYFEIFGWRRPKNHLSNDDIRDRICLNHFVAPGGYELALPHNDYWRMLYKNLIPIYGDSNIMSVFFKKNERWAGKLVFRKYDLRYKHKIASSFKAFFEFILGSVLGDAVESFLKKWQVLKIKRSLHNWYATSKPRVIYTNDVIEFHLEYVPLKII